MAAESARKPMAEPVDVWSEEPVWNPELKVIRGSAAEPDGAVKTSPVLDVQHLAVTFPSPSGPIHAVRDISLRLTRGEIVGLVGESGSGKSVFGLSVLGLLPERSRAQCSGRVLLGDTEMLTASADARRKRRGMYVSAVFQDPMTALNPSMRIGHQIAEAGGGSLAREEVLNLIDRVGLPDPKSRLRSYPHELSGGQRQRVMIAMALARKPQLIIADEPTTALDVTVQQRILELISEVAREDGTALLLITHDLGVAAQICDRVAVAYAGRIAELGDTPQTIGSPRHPYTVGLLASRPNTDCNPQQRLANIGGQPPDPRGASLGCSFAQRCPIAAANCTEELPPFTGSVACHRAGALESWPEHERSLREPMCTGEEVALGFEHVVRDFTLPRTGLRAGKTLRAVDDASFELRAGGALAVVGESGSGKTTALRMAVGLLAPTAGVVSRPRHDRPQLIFQDAGASLTPWLSIGEQVGERLIAEGVSRRQRRELVAVALERVGLPPEVERQLPRMLSGGQRQRAAIARAIVVPPKLLACDEPVSALDVSLAAQVLNLLGDLRAELGMALLFVTHDLAAARAIAEDVIVMHAGRIVEAGPAAAVFDDPQDQYTRELLSAVPRIPEAW